MGDSERRVNLREIVVPKKNFLKKHPFALQKGFSAFTFMFLGSVGTFPALPEINTQALVTPALAPVAEEGSAPVFSLEEACRWKKDFSFFTDLATETTPDEGEPCLQERVTPVDVAYGEQLGQNEQQSSANEALTETIREIAAGYPLEVMAPTIATYDRSVAALIVGIAKKESNWGERVPVDAAGADCFNYWGFKGAGTRGMAMGHGCFGSGEEAVRAVGNRITELVAIRKTSEPKNMIIWKCGSSCATHSPESVRKWIADVDIYYRKIAREE